MNKKTIGVLVGSLRRGSFSQKVATHISGLLEKEFDVKFLDTANLALYNQDLDNDSSLPQEWQNFRQAVNALDAVLFVTPEYNRSMPASLKNALDVASRPYAANAWSGKPGAVVSISPGSIGGFGANHHLRQTASCLNIYMMQQPEAYIGNIADAVDDDGVSDKSIQDFLLKFAGAFTDWVNKFDACSHADGTKAVETAEVAMCQSCALPFNEEHKRFFSTEPDGSRSIYCNMCYRDGKFTEPGITMDEMIEKIVPILGKSIGEDAAKKEMSAVLPTLERWQAGRV
ncbi:MAG: NAD(P)H-dependent oxidoreductase [Clostridiales bacterium]|nr:NAD(P)H-dependent oxidoreductase [Clostridiales bacterium]